MEAQQNVDSSLIDADEITTALNALYEVASPREREVLLALRDQMLQGECTDWADLHQRTAEQINMSLVNFRVILTRIGNRAVAQGLEVDLEGILGNPDSERLIRTAFQNFYPEKEGG